MTTPLGRSERESGLSFSALGFPSAWVRKPSSPLAAESELLTLERSAVLEDESGRASAEGTRSMWMDLIDRRGPTCDSQ